MATTRVVKHPSFDDVYREVPEPDLAAWKSQGWVQVAKDKVPEGTPGVTAPEPGTPSAG